jgi:hypothetical protein
MHVLPSCAKSNSCCTTITYHPKTIHVHTKRIKTIRLACTCIATCAQHAQICTQRPLLRKPVCGACTAAAVPCMQPKLQYCGATTQTVIKLYIICTSQTMHALCRSHFRCTMLCGLLLAPSAAYVLTHMYIYPSSRLTSQPQQPAAAYYTSATPLLTGTHHNTVNTQCSCIFTATSQLLRVTHLLCHKSTTSGFSHHPHSCIWHATSTCRQLKVRRWLRGCWQAPQP